MMSDSIKGGKSVPVPVSPGVTTRRGRKLSPKEGFAEGAWSVINGNREIPDSDIRNLKKG